MRRALVFAAAMAFANPSATMAAPPPPSDSGFSGRVSSTYLKPDEVAAFAKQVERNLAAKSARLAIVFRTGRPRDQLPKGISYTHGAFWVYTDIAGADGKTLKGYAVYNLYQGDGQSLPVDQSELVQDFPVNFINGSKVDDVAVIIPSPEMQQRILDEMATPTYDAMHVKSYTLVSNPLNATHQNCTEFVLDVVAAAIWQTGDYRQVKANLTANFKPTIVHANLFQRIFGPMVNPALNLDDQDGEIETATFESIAEFMNTNGLLKEAYIVQRER